MLERHVKNRFSSSSIVSFVLLFGLLTFFSALPALAAPAAPSGLTATAANPPKYPPIVAGEYITARYDGSYAYRQKT